MPHNRYLDEPLQPRPASTYYRVGDAQSRTVPFAEPDAAPGVTGPRPSTELGADDAFAKTEDNTEPAVASAATEAALDEPNRIGAQTSANPEPTGSDPAAAPLSDVASDSQVPGIGPDLGLDDDRLPSEDEAFSIDAAGAPNGPSTVDEASASEVARGTAVLAALAALATQVETGLSAMQHEFETKIAYDRFKEQQIERLHGELQKYRADIVARTARPLVDGLIRLHGDMSRILRTIREASDEAVTVERMIKHFDEFREDVETLLADTGVDFYEDAGPGEPFNPRRQRAIKRVETDDTDRHGRVCERLMPGCEQGSIIIQKERVTVYVATPV